MSMELMEECAELIIIDGEIYDRREFRENVDYPIEVTDLANGLYDSGDEDGAHELLDRFESDGLIGVIGYLEDYVTARNERPTVNIAQQRLL